MRIKTAKEILKTCSTNLPQIFVLTSKDEGIFALSDLVTVVAVWTRVPVLFRYSLTLHMMNLSFTTFMMQDPKQLPTAYLRRVKRNSDAVANGKATG